MSKSLRTLLRTLALGAVLVTSMSVPTMSWAQTQPQQGQQAQPQQSPLPLPQFRDGQAGPSKDFQQMREAQRTQIRERIAAGIQKVQAACRNELTNYCGSVTPGEGRLLLCMQAHEDKISNQCGMALFEASRNIEQAAHRVEKIADACWGDIQRLCTGGGSIGQCVMQNQASLSPGCQAVVAAIQPPAQQQAQQQQQQPSLAGMPIYSADGMKLGEITGVRMGMSGQVQLIRAELGSQLGLGTSTVLMTPDELQWTGDKLQLRMNAQQVRNVLQQQSQQ
jgi:Golgi apparatus protein 1